MMIDADPRLEALESSIGKTVKLVSQHWGHVTFHYDDGTELHIEVKQAERTGLPWLDYWTVT